MKRTLRCVRARMAANNIEGPDNIRSEGCWRQPGREVPLMRNFLQANLYCMMLWPRVGPLGLIRTVSNEHFCTSPLLVELFTSHERLELLAHHLGLTEAEPSCADHRCSPRRVVPPVVGPAPDVIVRTQHRVAADDGAGPPAGRAQRVDRGEHQVVDEQHEPPEAADDVDPDAVRPPADDGARGAQVGREDQDQADEEAGDEEGACKDPILLLHETSVAEQFNYISTYSCVCQLH